MTGKTEYKNRWQAENRERINLVVPKGFKAIVRHAADNTNESLNGYIKKAIDSRLELDGFSTRIKDNKDRKIESNYFIDDNEKLTFTNNTESEG